MLGAKIPLKKAEKIKNYLMKNGLVNYNYISKRTEDSIIFPVTKKFFKLGIRFVDEKFEERIKKQSFKDIMKQTLTYKELEFLKTAHDVVGTIAILEVPEELVEKEKLIAEALLKTNKNIKTVLKKAGEHSGVYRTQKMKWLAGDKTKVSIHKENNVQLKIDVEKVFFSARLGTERKRIMQQIKKGEEVMVLFSGCAPYVCVFAKNTNAKEVYGIELNPAGHKLGLENIKLNKLKNVKLIEGDVKKIVPNLHKKFDRISMQLPKSAADFLPEAFMLAKTGTIIHFYDFLHENDFADAEKKIAKACKKARLKYEILGLHKCGQFSPGKFRVCLDFKIV
ncbi:MAG: class I SAM-dependent methyltransferase family protein [archaeon]